MWNEIWSGIVFPLILTALTGVAGYIGLRLRAKYEEHVNTETKERIVRICVKAAEQLYHELSGEEKLAKAEEAAVEMLRDKGIPITELELRALVESVVCEFNYGFSAKIEENEKTAEPEADETEEYKNEDEEGASA